MIKINGFDIDANYGIKVSFDSPDSFLPDIETNFVELGGNGSYNYGSTYGNKIFTFNCMVFGDYISKVTEFTKLFMDHKGNMIDVKLEVATMPNKFYMVTLIENIKATPLSDKVASFELQLQASTPFAEASSGINKYFGESPEGTINIPIYYYGTKSTGFKVSMFGTVGSFKITVKSNAEDDQVFRYTRNAHSTFMVIDFGEFTILDNGDNGLPYASGKFLEIDRSTTSIIFQGEGASTSLSLEYTEKYT